LADLLPIPNANFLPRLATKAGCAALVMALLLTASWIRSHDREERGLDMSYLVISRQAASSDLVIFPKGTIWMLSAGDQMCTITIWWARIPSTLGIRLGRLVRRTPVARLPADLSLCLPDSLEATDARVTRGAGSDLC